jgi:hypothetical protein
LPSKWTIQRNWLWLLMGYLRNSYSFTWMIVSNHSPSMNIVVNYLWDAIFSWRDPTFCIYQIDWHALWYESTIDGKVTLANQQVLYTLLKVEATCFTIDSFLTPCKSFLPKYIRHRSTTQGWNSCIVSMWLCGFNKYHFHSSSTIVVTIV